MSTPSLRVGVGFDSHRMVPGRACMLGGVRIEHDLGPLGHSDGDAVLHALADALLGAAGLDDLGTLFPDSDPRWKGVDSARLLAESFELVRERGWRAVNVDIVVVVDRPRIAPHRDAMRERIASLLALDAESVNIKGKTFETIGESSPLVQCHAVCLIAR
jgi:2-C-methyl-D-erythritol 2,4-cyclodiphosphate synthase